MFIIRAFAENVKKGPTSELGKAYAGGYRSRLGKTPGTRARKANYVPQTKGRRA